MSNTHTNHIPGSELFCEPCRIWRFMSQVRDAVKRGDSLRVKSLAMMLVQVTR